MQYGDDEHYYPDDPPDHAEAQADADRLHRWLTEPRGDPTEEQFRLQMKSYVQLSGYAMGPGPVIPDDVREEWLRQNPGMAWWQYPGEDA